MTTRKIQSKMTLACRIVLELDRFFVRGKDMTLRNVGREGLELIISF